MPVALVDATDDPRIVPYRNTTDATLLRDHGLFVAEGRLVVRTLLTASKLTTRSVLVTRPALESLADVLPADTPIPVLVVPQHVMNTVVGFNIHRGCLALGERPPERTLRDLIDTGARRIVVLENVSNADNVGGIFRCAAAFDAAVALGPHCTDPLYRKAIRTSIGAALRVPFANAGDWPAAIGHLREAGYHVVALTPARDAEDLDEVSDMVRPMEKVALLIGSEGEGLTVAAVAAADRRVRIRVSPTVDSLNAAVAAGIALHRLSSS